MAPMQEREKRVALIGGAGKMGALTRRLFEQAGLDVVISDIADPTTVPASEAIRRSGIVFFSVLPIENIETVIRETRDVFEASHKVLDNATVKNPLKKGYQMLDRKGASICSTHLLFKDDQPPSGQNVLIVPFGQHAQEATHIAETVYGKAGMVLIHVDFDKHDELLLLNQFLPHLVNRAVGEVLVQLGADFEALAAISTANSRLFSLAVFRTLVQDPEISAVILESGLRTAAGRRVANTLDQALSRIRQESGVRRWFGRKSRLEHTFQTATATLDPTGAIQTGMNEKSIMVLELLANLSHHSVTLEIDGDEPGLLIPALQVLKEHKINLKALASREKIGKGWRFGIGIASGQITPEIQEALTQLGFTITNLIVPKDQE